MSGIPRRVRKINFSEHDAENIELNEDGLQGPPRIDNILPRMPHESTNPIKIIWPNGDMRQIVGVFRSNFLSNLKGGKIIVGTDQNGVPNERSGSILSSYLAELAKNSTIAPLHIPRWDNEMFKPKQQEMIRLVEKICLKNSACAKQQKNSHTTGRKGHARLLKEMETERNGKVSKIELWDRAHKRKDNNNYSVNDNIMMVTSDTELSRQKLDGKECLSSKDDSAVSKSILAKRKLRGFYHDKYWSHVKVSEGMVFVDESEQDEDVLFKVRAIGDNVENMKDEFQMMCAFMAKKFPGEDYRNVLESAENNEVDLDEDANNTNIQREINNDIQKSSHNMHASSNTSQDLLPGKCPRIKDGNATSPVPHEYNITKEAHPEICAKKHQGCVPHEQVTKQQLCPENYSKESYANSALGRRRITAMVQKTFTHQTISKFLFRMYSSYDIWLQKENNENSTKADQGRDVSSFPHNQPSNKDKLEVYLFSANPRNRDKVVAIGSLVSQDKTYVVGGNMLGDEFYGVLIKHSTPIAHEKLPRPYKDIQTVKDAVRHVIAWPRFYVKKKKSSSTKTSNNLVNSGAKCDRNE